MIFLIQEMIALMSHLAILIFQNQCNCNDKGFSLGKNRCKSDSLYSNKSKIVVAKIHQS